MELYEGTQQILLFPGVPTIRNLKKNFFQQDLKLLLLLQKDKKWKIVKLISQYSSRFFF